MEYRKQYHLKKLVSAAMAAIMTATSAFVTVPASAADAAESTELIEWNGTAAVTFAGGTGTEADPYQIATGEQLAYLAQQVNAGTTYEGEYLTLTSDILLNDDLENDQNVWVPIGKLENQTNYDFMGTFDGAYHSISGMYINTTGDAKGLFGCIGKSGTIKNVSVDGQISSGFDYGAGICGRNDRGTISECHSAVDITGTNIQFSGGICGYNYGKIYDCTNSGKITYTDDTRICAYIGGICGYSSGGYGLMSGCTNTATIDMDDFNYIGGICGYSSYTRIVDCKNTGKITGDEGVGGICGYLEQNSIENCHNSGTVYGFTNYTGGICGRASGDAASIMGCSNTGAVSSSTGNTGGISGYSGLATVSRCYNTADVISSSGSLVGGICGVSDSVISECYNTGWIWTTEDHVGGIVGYLGDGGDCSILNCYNTGIVWGDKYAGGIWGGYSGSDAPMKNCYNTGDVKAYNISSYGVGIPLPDDISNVYFNTDTCTSIDHNTDHDQKKTTKELTCSTVISDLGFDSTVWSKKANSGGYLYYPDLKCFDNDQPKEVLPAPENVTATAGEGKITLAWDAVTGADKYRIRRNDGTGWVNYKDVTTVGYADTAAGSGVKYSYVIYTCINGAWSGASAIVSATPTGSVIAQNVKATAGTGKVTLTWSAVSGATKYRVRRNDGSGWVNYKDLTSTSFTDTAVTNGTKYSYAIYSYVGNAWGGASAIVSATPTGSVIAQNVKATAGTGKVTLTWSAVSGATKYRVRRNDGSGWVNYKDLTSTSFTDTAVTNGTKYSYAVYAYVGNAWGGASAIVSATPTGSVIAQNVKATAGEGKVTLTWGAVSGATKYRIRRNDGTGWVNYKDLTTLAFVDTSVTEGKTYYYAVYSYVNGAWGGASAIVSTTPTASTVAKNVNILNHNGGLIVSWDTVTNATMYRIRRNDGTGWVNYIDLTNTAYVDWDVTSGKTYYYAIYTYVNGAWGGASAIVNATA